MSGGSMDYVCYKIAEYAPDLCDKELTELAKDFAEVYRAAEWWHSADTDETEYRRVVANFKEKWFGGNRDERLKGYVAEIVGKAIQDCFALSGVRE